jgi:hypothetical protein
MKKIVLGFSMLFIGVTLFGQNMKDFSEVQRAALKTEKKAIVAEVMQMTDEQSVIFWPLYNEYNEKLYAINTKKYDVIIDFAEHIDAMSDEKALDLWTKTMAIDQEYLKLKKTYFNKFKKILPPILVVRYFQMENKMDMLINAELALQIPLMEE